MILASIILYGVVDLRRLAKMGLLDGYGVQLLEELPISASDVVKLVVQNKQVICNQIGQDSTNLYLKAFDSLIEEDTFELDYNDKTGQTLLANSFNVVHVGDEHSETELVYGICVCASKKQITVAFRGCTTQKDWRISANPFLSSHDNPDVVRLSANPTFDSAVCAQQISCCSPSTEPQQISIHQGFYKYLFQPAQDNDINKYDAIMKNLQLLLQQYPGYQIYVTGHSLGGALATVFSFYAAASGIFHTPVTCIPIASPMVGNLAFEKVFKSLERQGRLRCLRITNHFDIFTQLPDRGALLYAACYYTFSLAYLLGATFLFYMSCQNHVYRHVGMDLHLYENGTYKVKHARGSSSNYCWRVLHDWKQHWKRAVQRAMTVPFSCCCDCCCLKQDFNANHGIQEHWKRLHGLNEELNQLYLNGLYEERRFDDLV